MNDNSRLVYSTDDGGIDLRRGEGGAHDGSAPRRGKTPPDGVVRVRREVKGRAGKTVTTIEGVAAGGGALEKIASELKKRCSAGGSVKDGVIVLQGDHRAAVVRMLEEKGYRVKLAGG